MAITSRIARPQLAAMFIVGGIDALRRPEPKAKAAQAVTVPLTRRLPWLPDDPELFVRVNGAVQVGAGVLLAAGRFRRLAALALIASIVPTTYAGHRFWEEEDETARAQQRTHFLKNLGLTGGLILAAFDTEGEPSLGWRAPHRAARLGAAMAVGRTPRAGSSTPAGAATEGVATLIRHAQDTAGEMERHLADGATRASRRAKRAAVRAARRADRTGHLLAENVAGAGQRAAESVSHGAQSGVRALKRQGDVDGGDQD